MILSWLNRPNFDHSVFFRIRLIEKILSPHPNRVHNIHNVHPFFQRF